SHEEALAHLRYAITQGDGFVLITGEVGTGKTTLCRAFLDRLDENTEAALIFNPKLDSLELLRTINDEFGIDSGGESAKDLIDTLNTFLMEKKAADKKVILLIDEAQNLSQSVLEQLRLLSNLETNVSKLLQIILVGQPELGEMLDSHELRQLGQRITLSCLLVPLTLKESREYIEHRINIAAQRPAIKFTRMAHRFIHNYSSGIPRLINIACDRALLTAFSLNRRRITAFIARLAIRELTGPRAFRPNRLTEGIQGIAFLSGLCVVFLAILYFHLPVTRDSQVAMPVDGSAGVVLPVEPEEPKAAIAMAPTSEAAEDKVTDAADDTTLIERTWEVDEAPVMGFDAYLQAMDTASSRGSAVKAALDLWSSMWKVDAKMDTIGEDRDFFRIVAKQNGFLTRPIACNLNLVRKINLPAIMALKIPGDLSVRYLTLSRMGNNRVTLRGRGGDTVYGTVDQLESHCAGEVIVLWKDFYSIAGQIPLNAPDDSIITLKMQLQGLGFGGIKIGPLYDNATENAVRALQQKHGIPVDGIVGGLTKIVLYNDIGTLAIPHLSD
ncbi:MAG: AAA family ATPase, partial [Desulfobacterales bacterium]